MITEAIGLGLFVSLLFSEIFGVAAGGMIVPGYIAYYLDKPKWVLATVLVALLTYLLVITLSQFIFLYGRRRLVVTVLLSFLIGFLGNAIGAKYFQTKEVQVIGFIIPGLLANWMERQGVLITLYALTVASVLIRLILYMLHGGIL